MLWIQTPDLDTLSSPYLNNLTNSGLLQAKSWHGALKIYEAKKVFPFIHSSLRSSKVLDVVNTNYKFGGLFTFSFAPENKMSPFKCTYNFKLALVAIPFKLSWKSV
jgi:hypothetical protein